MSKIQVLDCTLRDGGYCNNCRFGFDNEKKIVHGLVEANINIIECGFLMNTVEYDGLKAFLGKDYEGLITLDFVCHGVASPKIWREYLQLFVKEQPKSIVFKDKIKGWKKWHVKYELMNKTIYRYGIYDIYIYAFIFVRN